MPLQVDYVIFMTKLFLICLWACIFLLRVFFINVDTRAPMGVKRASLLLIADRIVCSM